MHDIFDYARFYAHYRAWNDGEIDLLVVVGDPGVGKSFGYREVLGDRPYHRLGGRQTPLHVYITLYDAPDLPVVLDDISSLLRDPNFRDMLKALCDKDPRVLHWGTTTSKLEGRAPTFVCTSPVLIVMNELPPHDPDVKAILDRCDAIRFRPTKMEVITRMRELFSGDGDLIELLNLLPVVPSLRLLEKARRWRASKHLNLVEKLLAECGVKPEVAQLVQIMETFPEREWCDRFVQKTGLTDRTYRRHKPFAEQLLACRKSPKSCPNVRLGPPKSVTEGSSDAGSGLEQPGGQGPAGTSEVEPPDIAA